MTKLNITFSPQAFDDYEFFQNKDRKMVKRINQEHRLVYTVNDSAILVASCRYHYK